MTCPDDPAAFLRNAMLHHADHLEPREDDIGRLKRKLAIAHKELAAWRVTFPDYQYRPEIDGFLYNGVQMFDG